MCQARRSINAVLPRSTVKSEIVPVSSCNVVTRLVSVLLGCLAAPAHAQDARLVASGPPSAELPYEFTKVAQVYELRDGRVLVLDQADAIVRLANLASGESNVLGRIGAGPGEYRLPLYLVPLGGDSVGVYDDAAVRFLVVNAEGELSGFAPVVAQGDGARVGGFVGDGRGWLYGELRSRSMRSDSAQLFRWRVGETNAQLVSTDCPTPPGRSSLERSGNGAARLLCPARYTEHVDGGSRRSSGHRGFPAVPR